jgi:group I intron endonuclease
MGYKLMNAHIYLVTNKINGKQYVGQTTVGRNKVGHGWAITEAYKSHGKENFLYERICNEINNRNTLNFLEKFWIAVCGTVAPNGYNIELGGSDKGEVSESTRQKMSLHLKGRPIKQETKEKIRFAMMGEKNPFYGKTHTPEAIEKIVAANVGKTVVITEATKEKIRQKRIGSKNPMYGKPITEEHRQKLRDNSARNKHWLGKKFSDEHKAHLTAEKVCSHCGKIGKGNAMIRYHMDNCKQKESA